MFVLMFEFSYQLPYEWNWLHCLHLFKVGEANPVLQALCDAMDKVQACDSKHTLDQAFDLASLVPGKHIYFSPSHYIKFHKSSFVYHEWQPQTWRNIKAVMPVKWSHSLLQYFTQLSSYQLNI